MNDPPDRESAAPCRQPIAASLLSAYPADCRAGQIQPLGAAGGFSGALFWRLTAPRGVLCLRRWPAEHPNAERLEFIQSILWHVAKRGFEFAPTPIRTESGAGYLRHAGHLWELTPWMPGVADYFPERRPEKLSAALVTLAQFHIAAADFAEWRVESGEWRENNSPGRKARVSASSPNIAQRLDQLAALRSGGLQQIVAAVEAASASNRWSGLATFAKRIMPLFARPEPAIAEQLAAAARLAVPLQPCIRDVWHDHILFEGDRVSGLIDFGAMRIDSVSCDIARLLGSLAADDSAAWQHGLAAYQTIRLLSPSEMELIAAFDRSTTFLSGVNWLQWVFVQQRNFADPAVVIGRVKQILARLEHL